MLSTIGYTQSVKWFSNSVFEEEKENHFKYWQNLDTRFIIILLCSHNLVSVPACSQICNAILWWPPESSHYGVLTPLSQQNKVFITKRNSSLL